MIDEHAVYGGRWWCDTCGRSGPNGTRCDCPVPEPLPSSGVPGADRFLADEEPLRVEVPTESVRVRATVRTVTRDTTHARERHGRNGRYA